MFKHSFKKKNHLIVTISFVIVILFSILIISNKIGDRFIRTNGIDNVGFVSHYKFISYIENDVSGRLISFHQISINYKYKSLDYSTIFELSQSDFDKIIGSEIREGDEIFIRHLENNPRQVILY